MLVMERKRPLERGCVFSGRLGALAGGGRHSAASRASNSEAIGVRGLRVRWTGHRFAQVADRAYDRQSTCGQHLGFCPASRPRVLTTLPQAPFSRAKLSLHSNLTTLCRLLIVLEAQLRLLHLRCSLCLFPTLVSTPAPPLHPHCAPAARPAPRAETPQAAASTPLSLQPLPRSRPHAARPPLRSPSFPRVMISALRRCTLDSRTPASLTVSNTARPRRRRDIASPAISSLRAE